MTPRPSYTPPADAGPVRTPGGAPRPYPGVTAPDAGTPPRSAPPAVGGPVRPLGGVDLRSSVRTIYERPTPRPDIGDVPTSKPRPVTGADLADRYGGRSAPRPEPRPNPTAGGLPSAPRAAPRTNAADRYTGLRPMATPRPRPAGSGGQPTLQPRPGVPPGVRNAVGANAPRLLPRSIYGGYGGYGYPGRSLYCNDARWNSWWNYNAALCFGLSSSSFCWSFGAPLFGSCWAPSWQASSWCYDSCYYQNTWSWWAQPRYTSSCWWWPSTCYLPTWMGYDPAPSTVIVIEREAPAASGVDVVDVGSEVGGAVHVAPTPTELAQRYVNLGDFYFKAERFAEAADAYARARTYAPDDPSLHFLLADAAFATGDYHFAAFLIGEALRLEPDMARAEADKRLFYGKPATFEAQLATLQAYLAEKPYDAMGWLVLGYNRKFSASAEAAKKAFARVLEIEPENRTAQRFLAALEPVPAAPAEATPPAAERKDG